MNKESINFLKTLQQQMLTQDNCGLANPRFWVVAQEVKTYGINEDCGIDGTEVIYEGEIIGESLKDMYECLIYDFEEDELNIQYIDTSYKPYILIDGKEEIKELEDLVDYMHNELGYDSSLYTVNYKIEQKIMENTMFLTLDECKRHIECNKHHYHNDPYPYAMTAWRSPQVKELFDILMNTDWDNIK